MQIMRFVSFVALIALLLVVVVKGQGPGGSFPPVSLGTALFHSYNEFDSLPINTANAQANGWVQNSSTCDPNLGILWTQENGGTLVTNPISLYFTPGGQVAGIGVTYYGKVFQNLVNLGYLQSLGTQQGYPAYFISVTFRNSSTICSTQTLSEEVGDTLIVNANSIAVSLPLTNVEAANSNWFRGACFENMGTHYFYDLHSAPNMTWVGANLLPIVLMFNGNGNGVINAFFFASGDSIQQGILNTDQWDALPLPNFLMCENWCSSSCTFNDTSFWSTMHIFTSTYPSVSCPGGCDINCCPGQ